MPPQVKTLVSKPDDLCLILRPYMVKGKHQPPQVVLCYPNVCHDTHEPLDTGYKNAIDFKKKKTLHSLQDND